MKYYGYYSAASDKRFGHALYETPDGLQMKVTEAVQEGVNPISLWNDAIYIGEITKCIKFNPIDTTKSVEQLLALARKELAIQINCQTQFPETGKCFCFTCPVVNNKN